MPTPVPRLPNLQRALRRSLIEHRDDDALSHIVADGLAPAERLDIYRNTFSRVLTAALRLSFPAVLGLVGEGFFEAAARIYIAHEPPRTACLDDYGVGVPAFLAQFEPAKSLPYLADVARLEWAVNRALHSKDAPPLSADRLALLAGSNGSRAAFVPHPALTLVRSEYPVDTIWRAVLDGDDGELRAVDLSCGGVWLLVERAGTSINVQRMSESPWRFTAQLGAGPRLPEAVVAETDFDAAALLADHLSKGRFVEVRLDANEH